MSSIRIVDYNAAHQPYFKQLNEEWITKYFELEPVDKKHLEEPETHIIKKGGHILMAMFNNEIVGTCALLKLNDEVYELAKMAVADKAKGKKIGYELGVAAIEKAKAKKAKRIELLSNRQLLPALNLYKKLGFKEVELPSTDYKRADIKMELEL